MPQLGYGLWIDLPLKVSFMDILKYLVGEWAVISQAPITLILIIVLVAAGVYWLTQRLSEGEISSLTARLKLRDDQIAQFEKKVGSASADEVSARIAALENRILHMQPRKITKEQRMRLEANIRGVGGQVQIGHDGSCSDGKIYAESLAEPFRNAGWHVLTPVMLGVGRTAPSGLGIEVQNPARPSQTETLVADTFRAIGVPFDLQQNPDRDQNHKVDVQIMIGIKLD